MHNKRVIPCLLLSGDGLVKTVKFKNPEYVGDPINTGRIFNDKEADELIILDIDATAKNTKINFNLLSRLATECFMPLCYGGGIRSLEDIQQLFSLGLEKVSLSCSAVENEGLIREAAAYFGSQSIVGTIDYRRKRFGKDEVFTHNGVRATGWEPMAFAKHLEGLGVGEILLYSIDRDGTMEGFDLELTKKISDAVTVPVIACGGAGTLEHLIEGVREGGASAVSAGSMFVFYGKRRAVLINYPSPEELQRIHP